MVDICMHRNAYLSFLDMPRKPCSQHLNSFPIPLYSFIYGLTN